MALSNKLGALVLTTGNKSEMAVGYCTLYGDMVGALAVIGDLVKTRVYAVCRWLNRDGEVIPAAILDKPPSAELRPGQMDTDSLAALRDAGPDPGGVCGALRDARTDCRRSRIPARSRPAGGAAGGAIGVQAPAGCSGAESDLEIIRHGAAIPDRRQGASLMERPASR